MSSLRYLAGLRVSHQNDPGKTNDNAFKEYWSRNCEGKKTPSLSISFYQTCHGQRWETGVDISSEKLDRVLNERASPWRKGLRAADSIWEPISLLGLNVKIIGVSLL